MFSSPGYESMPADVTLGVPPLDRWQVPPNLVWSMQHIAAFLPVRAVPRGLRATELGEQPLALAELPVPHPWEGRTASFAEVMGATFTDGWIVAKQGVVVGEGYTGTMAPSSVHLLMSVSKSLTVATAGTLVDSGELDPEALVTAYVPALAGSGYEGATVRQLMDMRTGVRFSEDYLDPDAEVRLLEQAIDWAPRRRADVPPTLLQFLATLWQERPHGGVFDYKSCETDALGFVIEGASGRHAAEVMSERVWQPMGAELSANVGVDSAGAGMFDGGISAGLRDLVRFGSLFVRDGFALDGVPVLSPRFVAETLAGAADSREAFAAATEPTLMPGGMYRNGMWFPREGSDVLLALGIHGQMIYIDRSTGVVAAKLSSWPTPQDGEKLLWTIAAFDAVAAAVS